MLLSRVMPYGRYICRLPARSLAVLCGSRQCRGKFTDHISLGALGRVFRTADVLPQIPVTRYGPSTRESGWLLGYRLYGIHSGAAGIDIEAVTGCLSIPIPTASGLLLHVAAGWYVSWISDRELWLFSFLQPLERLSLLTLVLLMPQGLSWLSTSSGSSLLPHL